MQPARIVAPLVRAFSWHRRWFAAIFAVLAVVAGLNAISARASGAVGVVVTNTAIATGATIAASQLSIAWLPAEAVAEGAFTDINAAAGGEAVVALPARTVVTPAMLRGDRPDVSAGKVALPVRFSDNSMVGVLAVGCHLDVLGPAAAGSGGGFSVVAADVRVIAMPQDAKNSSLGGTGTPLVLLEVNQSQAVAISAAAAGSGLSFALR